MAQTVCPLISGQDRQRLAAILTDRNRPQKYVARVRILLHSAEWLDVAEIARRAGFSKTRKPGTPRTPEVVVQQVVALTCGEPPGEATHWPDRMMAVETSLSRR